MSNHEQHSASHAPGSPRLFLMVWLVPMIVRRIV